MCYALSYYTLMIMSVVKVVFICTLINRIRDHKFIKKKLAADFLGWPPKLQQFTLSLFNEYYGHSLTRNWAGVLDLKWRTPTYSIIHTHRSKCRSGHHCDNVFFNLLSQLGPSSKSQQIELTFSYILISLHHNY